MDKVKPCPFCGNKKPFVGKEEDIIPDMPYALNFWAVCCDYNDGGCGSVGGYRPTAEQAIELWNTRMEEENAKTV